MRHKFNTATFCPEDIVAVAVNCFIERLGCKWPAFRESLGMTEDEFIEAIAAIIGPMSNIKGTTIYFTVAGVDFSLKVRKDGVAVLHKLAEQSVPDTGVEMLIDDTSPVPVTDILGAAFRDVSKSRRRSTDPIWLSQMLDAQWKYVDLYPDPIIQWFDVPASGGEGYNIEMADIIAREMDPNVIMDGAVYDNPGYDYLTDDFAAYAPLIGVTSAVLPVNIAKLLIQVRGNTRPINTGDIDFTECFATIERIASLYSSKGISVRYVQYSLEMGINNQADIVEEENDYAAVAAVVDAYIVSNHPSWKRAVDAYNADDTSRRLNAFNSTNAAIGTPVVPLIRQYFKNESADDYAAGRLRIYDFGDQLDLFATEFDTITTGQKAVFTQVTTDDSNTFRLKVGEGLWFAEFIMNAVNENIRTSGLIDSLTLYNGTRMISGNDKIYPLIKFVQLARGMVKNDGRISVTLDNPNLLPLGVLQGTTSVVYIINISGAFQDIDLVKLNGVGKTVTVETLYGDPLDDNESHITESGTSVRAYPHALIQITVQP